MSGRIHPLVLELQAVLSVTVRANGKSGQTKSSKKQHVEKGRLILRNSNTRVRSSRTSLITAVLKITTCLFQALTLQLSPTTIPKSCYSRLA